MSKVEKIKYSWEKIIYTLVAVILLSVVIINIMASIYIQAEEMAFETLHLETRQIKNDLNLQFVSDQENLITMASLAAELYENGEDFDIMFDSFKSIGLIENIGILTQDNTFITRVGRIKSPEGFDFEAEVEKGTHISERTQDVTGSYREIIRSAVPVKSNGRTVAMLYGVIDLETLKNRYQDEALDMGAHLIVVEAKTGKYIINTKRDKLGDITSLAPVEFGKNYSYGQLIKDLKSGTNGFTAFVPQGENEIFYSHYAPTTVGDWQIMLIVPQSVVFKDAHQTGNYMVTMFIMVVLVMLLYIFFIFTSDRKRLKISVYASMVRKRLLEVSNQIESFGHALESVTSFAKSRSAFFVDAYGDEYDYINPTQKRNALTGRDRKYFIDKLLQYASRSRKEHRTDVYISKITADRQLALDFPEFYNFLIEHDINSVNFAVIINNNANMNLLGAINAKNSGVNKLLKDIAVCFSMAIHNRKHLTRTESMALTDSLTNVQNRMAYKQDLKELREKNNLNLVCIYIDVNELHYFNNQYGHASGDQMLVFIAETLKEEFGDKYIYRMGGDEFLIFVENLTDEVLNEKIKRATKTIEDMKYHIAIGVKRGDKNSDIEEIVNLAEKEMYENKAKYYQGRSMEKISNIPQNNIKTMTTGIKEVDACLSIMSMKYYGVYCVDLDLDKAIQVMAPSYYFMLDSDREKFSNTLRKYIHDIAKPEYHRILLQLLDYELLKRQLKSGHNPRVSYAKVDGEQVNITIYSLPDEGKKEEKTIWVFEKDNS